MSWRCRTLGAISRGRDGENRGRETEREKREGKREVLGCWGEEKLGGGIIKREEKGEDFTREMVERQQFFNCK